ncbi:DUF6221 family protein [Streptomyces griseoluteus]|uniref:DUF6221 family protein n=1 Tax=Streptomyces griseoluteus TaxID=29306 RepID=UPI00342003FE
MDDLVEWLRAQLDEDARIARAILWPGSGNKLDWELVASATIDFGEDEVYVGDRTIANHVMAHTPARVLREVAAKRKLLDRWSELQRRIEAETDEAKRGNLALTRHGLDMFVYQLGTVYADRPGYREEWRP